MIPMDAVQGLVIHQGRDKAADLLAGIWDQIRQATTILDCAIDEDEVGLDETVDHVLDRICGTLRSPRDLAATLDASGHPQLRDVAEWRLDDAMARRIREIGLDPLALVAIARLCGDSLCVEIAEGPWKGVTIEAMGSLHGHKGVRMPTCVVDDGIAWDAWDGDVSLSGRSLPETTLGTIAGTPLDEVVASRITAGAGIVATGAENHDTHATITIDVVWRPALTR